MSAEAKAITDRWNLIRKTGDLSLSPESVAAYLRIPESVLVRDRIIESLIQFADYRLETSGFASSDPPTPGDMATCEGLEAFLVPAVEGALPFSKFLEHYAAKGGNTEAFAAAIKDDISGLLDKWEKGLFAGEPYANIKKLQTSIEPNIRDQFKHINITESAALACRVLIHLLTLKLNRADEELFQEKIANELDERRMLAALKEAIDFLVRAFQKGKGTTEEEEIVNAKIGPDAGSGWSWTDRPGLPPMLFFTAAAVDAFAELDLYLIRPAVDKKWESKGLKLIVFHDENAEKLQHFQLCIDMARRWVLKAVLLNLIDGFGMYAEKLPTTDGTDEYLDYEKSPKGYVHYKEDLDRWELPHPPMVFYNSLYALLILLWSWGDRNDAGDSVNDDAKNKINRAISQLVFNYSSIPVVKEILDKIQYLFYLPGSVFKKGEKEPKEPRSYIDSAFLPLLTRLLVLFVVYGVGDRNMLEPVIRNLYVELLQSRHRGSIEYSALWSKDAIEVFSTQRSIQALTFYYAYASGKEIVEAQSGGGDVVLRNKTGAPLVLVFDRQSDVGEATSVPVSEPAGPREPPPDPDRITDEKFAKYCQKTPGWQVPPISENQAAEFLQSKTKALGDTILSDYKAGKISDSKGTRVILDALVDIFASPESSDGKVREDDLSKIEEQYAALSSQTAAASNLKAQ
jgi:hypothetical protein